MPASSEIKKITYIENIINPDDPLKPNKAKYILLPDGSERVYGYDYDKKAYVLIEKVFGATNDDYLKLNERIDSLIEEASGVYPKYDDVSGTVTIYRAFGRTEIFDRGYGTEEQAICELVTHYFYRYRRQGMRAGRFEKRM